MVTIVCESNSESADFAGRTVGDARAAYEVVFSIPAGAIPKVNNKQVSETYVLQDGDKLSFEKDDDKFSQAAA